MRSRSFDSARPLPRSFFLKPTLDVARSMIGKILVRRYRGSLLAGIIVEVEAYHGFDDMASHAYGRREGRSAMMYSTGGIAYVYFTYGMYHCLNVVTEHEGYPAAVLIRALEPVAGVTIMQRLRGTMQIHNLTNGPGKMCMALNITRRENGASLSSKQLFLTTGKIISPESVGTSRRIGISRSVEHEWRFFLKGNPFVSQSR
jgi:DNA-3-methyladenine glycosylase